MQGIQTSLQVGSHWWETSDVLQEKQTSGLADKRSVAANTLAGRGQVALLIKGQLTEKIIPTVAIKNVRQDWLNRGGKCVVESG